MVQLNHIYEYSLQPAHPPIPRQLRESLQNANVKFFFIF